MLDFLLRMGLVEGGRVAADVGLLAVVGLVEAGRLAAEVELLVGDVVGRSTGHWHVEE